MKKILTVLAFLLAVMFCAGQTAMASSVSSDGYYDGIRLAGKVKVVDYNADIKVKVVKAFPDLKVKVVNAFPDDIGEWQFVNYGEDFTVEFVDSFPDITIKFVEAFPGVD
jgi:hypothetical protein